MKNQRMKLPPVKGEQSVKEVSEDSIDLIPTSVNWRTWNQPVLDKR